MIATRQRSALVAFGIVFIVLLANALVSYVNIRSLRDSDALVRHTYEVTAAAEGVLMTAVDAETGQRGFLISGADEYLKPYYAAVQALDKRLERLENLTRDNRLQQTKIAELKSLVTERMTLLKKGIDLQRSESPDSARQFVLSGEGRRAMDRVRDKLREIAAVESGLFAERDRESEFAYWTAITSGAVAALLGLLLAVAGYFLVLRDVRRRDRAAAEMQVVNERLEDRVRERTETITNVINTLREEIDVRRAAEDAARESAEELQRSNRELEQFASVASHDLQEPLRKIQAFADRLETHARDVLGEKGVDYLDRILSSASRMRRLIDDLLAYSRVSTKGQAFSAVDLNAIVQEVHQDLEGRLHQTGGRIEWEPLPRVAADPVQMRQLFQNLLANALKFHRPDVPPVVSISAQSIPVGPAADGTEERDLQLRVSIRDNGIGFEPVYRDRIFDLFQRLHGRDQYEGTGIGLAICKKIVERHGGKISADSAPGEGAVFTFTLPFPREERGES